MNKINASQIQRKGLKEVYKVIDEYPVFEIENNRQDKKLYITKYQQNLGQIIQLIKKYKDKLKKAGAEEVYIFGSFAKGEADISSDIDIAYKPITKGKETISSIIKHDKVIKEILKDIPNLDLHSFSSLKEKIILDIKKWGISAF